MLFDTHSHIYFEQIKDQEDAIIARMRQYGVKSVQIGCRIESAEDSIALARKYPDILWASVGFHPTDSQEELEGVNHRTLEALETLISENLDVVVAVGECGLDYHYLSEDPTIRERQKQVQKDWWLVQYELSRKYNLPLIIHSRDAREDTLDFIRENGMTDLVMHCFSEDYEFAEMLMDHSDGIYFSFSGTVTYKSAPKIQEAARRIPLDRILIETDSPFLSPVPVRGTPNEPANVRYVLDKIIELRSEGREVIEAALYNNALRFYGLILE